MTQDQARLLESARAGSREATAALLDALFARVEGLEDEVRRIGNRQALEARARWKDHPVAVRGRVLFGSR